MVCILAQVSLTGPGLKPPQTLVVRLRKDHLPVETDQLKQDVTIKKEEDVLASLSAAQAKVQVKKVTVNTRKWYEYSHIYLVCFCLTDPTSRSGLIAQPVSFLTKRVPSPLAHALKVRTPPSEVRVISPIVGYMIRRPDHEGRDRAFKRCKTC